MKKVYILLIIILILFFQGCTKEDEIIELDKGNLRVNSTIDEKIDENIDEKIDEILGIYKDNISIYYKNLNTNEEYTLNPDKYYVAASTTKVPLCMMILDQVFEGTISLEDTIYYEEADSEGGSGVLYYLSEFSNISIGEAVYLSIVESDNIAKNMLHRISGVSLTDYLRDITADDSIPYGNSITAGQLCKVLERLYENPDNNPYYEKLIEYMKETVFHDRLDKYIPYDLVAHKIGDYYRYYHDFGIVYAKEPYIIVILTKDIGDLSEDSYENGNEDERYLLDGGNKAYEMIANISKEIYLMVEEDY
ncbi:MAG: serine hydrolase [Clostridium sp.]|uniref:serine hydrolase n=1 Tax=Clostridium sp. TaxID=1506 RepID=UPI001EC66365|nr:serine hydrolase [Clostridium sp.]MBS5884705.1 serine hydrolase [Clostridium sp.]MDU7149412.1 serine hydrolase [Clostridium sp.]MDU7242660.1 serine hydrolase [Clostridium sp.]